jgi:hypothetical protein
VARFDPVAEIEISQFTPIDERIRDRVAISIHVHNVPTLQDNSSAGVATFHTLTGGEFRLPRAACPRPRRDVG